LILNPTNNILIYANHHVSTMSLLDRAWAEGTAYNVAMDEVKFLQFDPSGLSSIGTANLNGCSAVMIVSIYGAILGHIPPRPDGTSQDLDAGDRHARMKMQEVATLFTTYKNYFPSGGNTWVLCAVFQGEVALPDQQKIMQDGLSNLGLSLSSITYVVGRMGSNPGKGTVFIDGSVQVPIVYVEDKNVSQGSTWPSSASQYADSSSYSSGSTSGYPGYATQPSSYATPAYATQLTYTAQPSSVKGEGREKEGTAEGLLVETVKKEKDKNVFYQFTNEDSKTVQTRAGDWKEGSRYFEGKEYKCLVYIGKKSGKVYHTWQLGKRG
jgi:hypothetical protein